MATQAQNISSKRVEFIHSGKGDALPISKGVLLREFVNTNCGAKGLSTGAASFEDGAVLPYHRHSVSEAIVILSGKAHILVEGRRYLLSSLDCLHVPAGVAHKVSNALGSSVLLALSAFASENTSRKILHNQFAIEERDLCNPLSYDPEHIVRFDQAEPYGLSEGTEFYDLFAGRFGSVGICGGYGRFQPGSSLPCHIHQYDESITIVEGEAICLVQGNQYKLRAYDTAFVPEGRPHRFLNNSTSSMAMVWVYAGSEPERTLVDSAYCSATSV